MFIEFNFADSLLLCLDFSLLLCRVFGGSYGLVPLLVFVPVGFAGLLVLYCGAVSMSASRFFVTPCTKNC